MSSERFDEAYQLYEDGRYEEAAAAFRQIDGAEAAYAEAVCFQWLGRSDEAREAIERCLAADPEHEDARKLLEALTPAADVPAMPASIAKDASETVAPASVSVVALSAKRNRPFAGRSEYPSAMSLAEALRSAREALPAVRSAYRASGVGFVGAVLMLVLASPVMLVVLMVLCLALCVGFAYLVDGLRGLQFLTADQFEQLAMYLAIFLDIVLLLLIVFVPGLILVRIGRALRACRPRWVALLSFVVVLPVAALLFVPFVEGEALAPTSIIFLGIPLPFLFVLAGVIAGPIIAARFAYRRAAKQRFCRATGRLLACVRSLSVPFDDAEEALELLQRGVHEQVARSFFSRSVDDYRHRGQVMLWMHDRAQTAILELEVFFRGTTIAGGRSRETRATWLAYATYLDRASADRAYAAFAE